jgi:hypothetical protein
LQLVLGYFSRIFQDNYLAMILTIFSFGFLCDEEGAFQSTAFEL